MKLSVLYEDAKSTHKQIVHLFRSGTPINDIAKKFGVEPLDVFRHLGKGHRQPEDIDKRHALRVLYQWLRPLVDSKLLSKIVGLHKSGKDGGKPTHSDDVVVDLVASGRKPVGMISGDYLQKARDLGLYCVHSGPGVFGISKQENADLVSLITVNKNITLEEDAINGLIFGFPANDVLWFVERVAFDNRHNLNQAFR